MVFKEQFMEWKNSLKHLKFINAMKINHERFPYASISILFISFVFIVLNQIPWLVITGIGILVFSIPVFWNLHYQQREDEIKKEKNTDFKKQHLNEKIRDFFSITHSTIMIGILALVFIYFFTSEKFIFQIEISEMSYNLAKNYLDNIFNLLGILYASLIIGFSIHATTGETFVVYKRELFIFFVFMVWATMVVFYIFILPLMSRLAQLDVLYTAI